MKLIVLKNNLKDGLDSVGRAIGSQLNLPVLGNVLIKTDGNQIKISATNLEFAITKTVFGKVIGEGSITIPYSTIANVVNNVASERINLEKTKRGNLDFQTDNYKATIQGMDEKEFPIIPKIEKKNEYIETDTAVFKNAIASVIIAGEVSDLRPEIAGVLIIAESSSLKFVATDSFRLAESRISGNQIKNTFQKGFSVIVPLRAAQELTRVSKDEGKIRIYIDKNQVFFGTDDLFIVSRLIEGTFPDYASIIPDEIDTEVVVSRDELVNALKLSSSFASRSNDVRLKTKDKKIIEVYSSDSAVGENNYLIPAKIDGAPTEATFNWRYLLDGVRVGKTKEIFLGLSGDERPAVIKNPGDESGFYILMPIKQA